MSRSPAVDLCLTQMQNHFFLKMSFDYHLGNLVSEILKGETWIGDQQLAFSKLDKS